MTQETTERVELRKSDSKAVAVARAHIEAWSHHDFKTAKDSLAPDVHVTVTTTQDMMSPTDTIGIEKYMGGLEKFAQIVVPGSARIIASAGDDHNALIAVNVKAGLDPNKAPVTLTGARLYLLNEKNKIQAEQVIFCVLVS